MGNPATDSVYGAAKHEVQLALLPIGGDGRGNNYTTEVFQSFCKSWRESGRSPSPVYLTHDGVAEKIQSNRPAVGWITDFRVTPGHLMGTVKLLPEGSVALYGTHSSWSCEVSFLRGVLTVLGLALLGEDLPHFDNLNSASIYYSKSQNTKNIMETETDLNTVNDIDQLLDLNEKLNNEVESLVDELEEALKEIETLEARLAEAEGSIEGYKAQTLDHDVDEIYNKVISYGCDCNKKELLDTYKSTPAEGRPAYRNLITSLAKRAAEKANELSNGGIKANLIYTADTAKDKTEQTLRRMGGR